MAKSMKHPSILRLNTSNPGKLAEYQTFFDAYGITLEATTADLREIDADHISVVVHKASSVPEGVLVEDTSLDIDDEKVGINIRYLLDHLEKLKDKKAAWTCHLAQRIGNDVFVYTGVVHGTIVAKKGSEGFGFDPYFLPDGAKQTLAESKPDKYNARALAVKAFMEKESMLKKDPIFDWQGPWQKQ
jgi:XTP/dITP diphosphohydrolase